MRPSLPSARTSESRSPLSRWTECHPVPGRCLPAGVDTCVLVSVPVGSVESWGRTNKCLISRSARTRPQTAPAPLHAPRPLHPPPPAQNQRATVSRSTTCSAMRPAAPRPPMLAHTHPRPIPPHSDQHLVRKASMHLCLRFDRPLAESRPQKGPDSGPKKGSQNMSPDSWGTRSVTQNSVRQTDPLKKGFRQALPPAPTRPH